MPPDDHKSLARSLGEFFGHIVHAVKAPADPQRHEVRRETTEQSADTPLGPAILRRTVIEEIEIHPDARAVRNPPDEPPR